MLTADFWHREVILAVLLLDLETQLHFQYFTPEKNTTLQICGNLFKETYYSIDELEDGSTLNLQTAKNLIENSNRILNEEYSSHKKELTDIAKVFSLFHQLVVTETCFSNS